VRPRILYQVFDRDAEQSAAQVSVLQGGNSARC
jgi:hypothetical protein